MAKPAITSPIVDVIQVMDFTPANEQTICKQDIIAITDESAANEVYTSLAQPEPNTNQTGVTGARTISGTTTTHYKDLSNITGYITNLMGHIYVGTI